MSTGGEDDDWGWGFALTDADSVTSTGSSSLKSTNSARGGHTTYRQPRVKQRSMPNGMGLMTRSTSLQSLSERGDAVIDENSAYQKKQCNDTKRNSLLESLSRASADCLATAVNDMNPRRKGISKTGSGESGVSSMTKSSSSLKMTASSLDLTKYAKMQHSESSSSDDYVPQRPKSSLRRVASTMSVPEHETYAPPLRKSRSHEKGLNVVRDKVSSKLTSLKRTLSQGKDLSAISSTTSTDSFNDQKSVPENNSHDQLTSLRSLGTIPSFNSYLGEDADDGDDEDNGRFLPTSPNRDSTSVSSFDTAATPRTKRNSIYATVSDSDNPSARPSFLVIVLLLCPQKRSFELIHLNVDLQDVVIRDFIRMIPEYATDEYLASKRYVGFCQPGDGKELINSFSPEALGLSSHDIVIAIPKGYSGVRVAKFAEPILGNPRLIRKMKKLDRKKTKTQVDSRWKETMNKIALLFSSWLLPRGSEIDGNNKITIKQPSPRKRIKAVISPQRRNPFIAACGIIFMLSVLLPWHHRRISAPLKPGDELFAGDRRTNCGLLDYLPEKLTNCHSITFEMLSDSVMGVYEQRGRQRALSCFIRVDTSRKKGSGDNSQKRHPGASNFYIDNDGDVIIRGKNAVLEPVSTDGGADLVSAIHPWPFVILPPQWKRQVGGTMKPKRRVPLPRGMSRKDVTESMDEW
eukprot:CAMPEP_0172503130 /NCGR_PEP_ID=MMETSP1066-20121228/166414_1 /TAXON_ID=671091 /ORGANISM="Coscinodiscus wailesii, Strain CCMP2513" /LENGTH=688 /DNA_ID=CAMNT_0013278737 /DNA_START=43 /DNA_END=2106 /DNA_ORIENTATION=-